MATACGGDGSASGAGRGRDAGEGEKRESEGEIRGGAGRFWRGQGVEGEARRQLPWRACARCAATTRPVPLARGGGRLASASQLGRATGPIG